MNQGGTVINAGLTGKGVLHKRAKYPAPGDPTLHVRMLKIEAHGDFWKGRLKPKIRLMGYWLERAGFKPGKQVHITCIAPGVLELRSPAAVIMDKT